ncbi:hypothetical protein FAZ95_01890 [Trinickia violacea]|uniref:Uncharacterized protein n=1 Tax=Trinickia violacea TaxID=2571746 RepID=A0A4P8IMM3_9BURK|nr:hypothetical protein [Trinickia violacea]QCP48044.1 hypothetical protein FAZ95_01890 [Trinickia violacea]
MNYLGERLMICRAVPFKTRVAANTRAASQPEGRPTEAGGTLGKTLAVACSTSQLRIIRRRNLSRRRFQVQQPVELPNYAVGIMLILLAATLVGFLAFLYAGVFILGSLFPDLSYEAALPYLLGGALLGSVFFGWIAKRFCRGKTHLK